MDKFYLLCSETAAAKTYYIYAAIADWLTAGHNVGGDVLGTAATTLNHYISANVDELVEQNCSTNGGKVVNNYLAGNLCGVADNEVVAQKTIVSRMDVFHQKAIVAYLRGAFRGRASGNVDILTETVVVAYLAYRVLTLEFQVLGLG